MQHAFLRRDFPAVPGNENNLSGPLSVTAPMWISAIIIQTYSSCGKRAIRHKPGRNHIVYGTMQPLWAVMALPNRGMGVGVSCHGACCIEERTLMWSYTFFFLLRANTIWCVPARRRDDNKVSHRSQETKNSFSWCCSQTTVVCMRHVRTWCLAHLHRCWSISSACFKPGHIMHERALSESEWRTENKTQWRWCIILAFHTSLSIFPPKSLHTCFCTQH